MTRSKFFWRGMMCGAIGLYLLGFGIMLLSQAPGLGAALLACLLLLHIAEMKTALRIGRERGLGDARITWMNLAFGFTWWLPLKLGIFGGSGLKKAG